MDHNPDSLPASSQANVLIRPVRHSDVSAVTLLDASISGGQPRPSYFEERLAIIERSDTGQQLIFLVADSHGQIVGFVTGTLTGGQFGLAQITAVIDFIAVHPEYRRQHIGRRLIEVFLSQSAALG